MTEPAVRVISFTGSTKAGRAVGELGGAAPQARAPRARRQLRDARARRRGRRPAVVRRGLGVVPPPGPDLHDHRPPPGAGGIYDDYVERSPPQATGSRSATRPPAGAPLGPVIDAGQRDKIHALVTAQRRRRRAAGRRRHVRGPVLPADRAGRRARSTAPAFTEEVFGPVAPVMPFSSRRRGGRLAIGERLRPVARHRHPRCDARAGARRADPDRHRAHQRPDGRTTRRTIPFGGVGASGTGSRLGGATPTSRRSPRPSG